MAAGVRGLRRVAAGEVAPAPDVSFEATVDVAIVGAGACGLVAALAAAEAGVDALVLERDRVPQGSTALSSGMIPACGTAAQRAHGIDDDPETMTADIRRKARGDVDERVLEAVCHASGPVVDWLGARHGLELTLVEGFLYPGHRVARMHAPPSRTGADLIGGLSRAAAAAGIDVMTDARVDALFAGDDGTVVGLEVDRPGGVRERIGCRTLLLACNGFGGNRALLRRHIPDMAQAHYAGHVGNQGDAIAWGEALGAATDRLGAYQGHGSLAHPHGILITWALMMEGGVQVNALGERFSNEHDGYSEQARRVLAQPSGIAWDIYDARLHALGLGFEDYRLADAAGAVVRADDAAALAAACHLPAAALSATLESVRRFAAGEQSDPFGRDFTTSAPLAPPYHAVRVTGSLFHTQGGLRVDGRARVLRPDGRPLGNVWAGGGAACGLSGPSDWGYLSGNGLLTAVTLGRLGGAAAARFAAAGAGRRSSG